jgi:hypothetical protein
MQVTLDTRKPITDLTVNDLSAFPVWEFATDEEGVEGRDETWVRPIDTRVVPARRYSLQVAADLRTASGQTYSGFVIVSTARGTVEIDTGVILHRGEYLLLDYTDELLAQLGIAEADLFPISYTLRVPIEGEDVCRTGTVSG